MKLGFKMPSIIEDTEPPWVIDGDCIIVRNPTGNKSYPLDRVLSVKRDGVDLFIFGIKEEEPADERTDLFVRNAAKFGNEWYRNQRFKDSVDYWGMYCLRLRPHRKIDQLATRASREILDAFAYLSEKTGASEIDAQIESSIQDRRHANEHCMKCNVCGNIFCFTNEDLKQNAINAENNAIAGALGLINLVSPVSNSTLVTATNLARAGRGPVRDFSHCPKCGSENISPFDPKTEQSKLIAEPQAGSAADEILKFKNLLDQGVITQEEFDMKKKQLLGL